MLKIKFNHHTVNKGVYPILLVCLALIAGACSKQTNHEGSPATLQVFNALDNGQMVRVNMSGKHPILYSKAFSLQPRSVGKFNTDQAIQPMAFYAAADTLPKDKPVWQSDLKMETGKIYTMFLFNGPEKAETIFQQENFPRNVTDSVTFLRFLNLSSSQAITANIAGNPNGSLISNLEYKSMSPVVQLPVNKSTASYTFEVRDAVTGTLLAFHTMENVNDFTYRNLLFRTNWTLVLTGRQGETGNNLPRLTAMYHL